MDALPLTDAAIDELLSRPSEADAAAAAAIGGDLVILGVSGKMGPSMARLARRAGVRRVIGVARFSDPKRRDALEADGITTVAADLLDPEAAARLPDAAAVIYMVGQKFGTTDDPARTWAVNTVAPAHAVRRYRGVPFVAFSTGNVYPLTAVADDGPDEEHPAGPVGEYAQSALARERVLTFLAGRHGSPMAILRLNYAVEPRYGVLRDVADRVRDRRPIDLSMGYVNVIWQRDACSVALRTFAHCAVPPFLLNVTGPDVVPIRNLAERFGARFGRAPIFANAEADTALLSDASRMVERFGRPGTGLDEMVNRVAEWLEAGGRRLGKWTGYEVRDGHF